MSCSEQDAASGRAHFALDLHFWNFDVALRNSEMVDVVSHIRHWIRNGSIHWSHGFTHFGMCFSRIYAALGAEVFVSTRGL